MANKEIKQNIVNLKSINVKTSIFIGNKENTSIEIENVYQGLNKNKYFLLFDGTQGSLKRTFSLFTKGCKILIGALVTAGLERL